MLSHRRAKTRLAATKAAPYTTVVVATVCTMPIVADPAVNEEQLVTSPKSFAYHPDAESTSHFKVSV
jgi:hypothetical protein